MRAFGTPVVAYAGSVDPAAPLVVLLHGRGSNERDIVELSERLCPDVTYAAVRAPITEGGGYAWFANRGIGRPVAESLRATMDWFRGWLDRVASADRPVVLVGFSGGAAFAGGLLLDDPARYAGAAILYGTLPFDAGVPVTPARLAGVPVVVAHGEQDTVIPRELLDRTWTYLLGESGAPTLAHRDPGGHGISPATMALLQGWLRERLALLTRRTASPSPTTWRGLPAGQLTVRTGTRPAVSWVIPQQQLNDNAPSELQERLFHQIAAQPGVSTGPSAISVPGARGFALTSARPAPEQVFLAPALGEFAHLHPAHDGFLHLALPTALAADVVAKGWGVAHPLAGVRLTPGMVMLYGPRDAQELDTVVGIVTTSHAWASGQAEEGHASWTSV